MNKLIIVGVIVLSLGISFTILDVAGVHLFQTASGSSRLIGRVINSQTGEDEAASMNLCDEKMVPKGASYYTYGKFNVSIPSGTWGLLFLNSYYYEYEVYPKLYEAGKTYDLGVIALQPKNVSLAHAKLESVKSLVNNVESNHANTNDSIVLVLTLINDGTSEGVIWAKVWDINLNKTICEIQATLMGVNEKIEHQFSPFSMPNSDLRLRIEYGHKLIDYTPIKDGEYYYTIYLGQPFTPTPPMNVSMQMISGIVLIVFGVIVTVMGYKQPSIEYRMRR